MQWIMGQVGNQSAVKKVSLSDVTIMSKHLWEGLI